MNNSARLIFINLLVIKRNILQGSIIFIFLWSLLISCIKIICHKYIKIGGVARSLPTGDVKFPDILTPLLRFLTSLLNLNLEERSGELTWHPPKTIFDTPFNDKMIHTIRAIQFSRFKCSRSQLLRTTNPLSAQHLSVCGRGISPTHTINVSHLI